MKRLPAVIAMLSLASVFPVLAADEIVDFVRDVKPLLEGACVRCHHSDSEEKNGGFRLDREELAFRGGETYGAEVIKVSEPHDSPLYWMTIPNSCARPPGPTPRKTSNFRTRCCQKASGTTPTPPGWVFESSAP